MKYSLKKDSHYTILALEEERLDSTIAPELKSEMLNLQAIGTTNLILDLSATQYADSSGLSALLTGNRAFGKNGGCFVLNGVSDFITKLLSISKLIDVLNIAESEAQAIGFIPEKPSKSKKS